MIGPVPLPSAELPTRPGWSAIVGRITRDEKVIVVIYPAAALPKGDA